ncbi:MAG TPA: sulfatase-like hydrolase/transferase [Terriglobales bacterium]|jgi:arylsulfatase A-like enzyme/Flp pilus assembly protein TadD|nr:sulfatase-like hydrolase/transferase [Terriglobales bacterium]
MRFPGRLCFVLFCVGSVLAADLPPAAPRPVAHPIDTTHPNIILITLDTTRADRMGFLGSKRGLTPHLDAMAQQGIVFTRAYAHVPITTASHTTILTGTYPQFNHVNDFGIPLSSRLPYLPDLLRAQGYHTGAFVGSLILDPLDGTAPGFDRGFEVYDAGFHLRRHGADRYKSVERRADDVVNHALAWLSQLPNGPFFLWVHLYDAHDPYDPPAPFKARFASQPYDGEIAYADSAVGRLFDEIRKHGLYDETLIAVMADHGESLGAHGENTHGIFLYDETLHVPLVFKLPASRAAGRRIETRARLVDVAPTILQEAGIAVPKEMQGESLTALMVIAKKTAGKESSVAPSQEDRSAYAETDYPHRGFGWSSLRALRTGKYLYIRAPERELYNQEADPSSEHNLAATAKAVADTVGSQLDDFRAKTSQTLVDLAKPDAEQTQKLQALGYVASDASETKDSEKLTGADPKTKIQVSNLLHDAMFDVEDARYEEAIPLLKKALAEQPELPVANMQYGIAQARLKNYSEAVGALQKAVGFMPDNGLGRYELGLALFETGDWKGAATHFEAAVEHAPKWADAQFSLASVYARTDRVPDAMDHLDICLGLDPRHYRANLLRGRILTLQHHAAEALPNLQKAVEVQPDSREGHLFLADAYEQLGETAKASAERARVGSR